jgi:hypothetical protein
MHGDVKFTLILTFCLGIMTIDFALKVERKGGESGRWRAFLQGTIIRLSVSGRTR